ncbi:MAG: phage minor capsid protein [Lachnospiraceae bacterium]
MMTPEEKGSLPIRVEKLFYELQDRIFSDIVRRIRKTKKITSTADYQINKLLLLGGSTEFIESELKRLLTLSDPEIWEMYDKVCEWEYVRNRDAYEQINGNFTPLEDNDTIQGWSQAIVAQTQNEIKNLTRSLGMTVDIGGGKMAFTPLAEYYQKHLDRACMDVVTGSFDYNTVLRRVVKELSASGLQVIDYSSGWRNRAPVAARRAVLTGVSQLSAQINEQVAKDLKTDKYEVSWHSGHRPSHWWGGRVYTYQELQSVCGLGEGDGLCGWNCRHSYYAFLEGYSIRTYTDEQLDRMEEKEQSVRTYRGKEYNAYQASQAQRKMETTMRAQRAKVRQLQQGDGDKDDIIAAKARYLNTLHQYQAFSRKMELPEQMERVYMDGLGRVITDNRISTLFPQKMVDNMQRDLSQYKKYKKVLGESIGSLDKFGNIKYNDSEQWEKLQKKFSTYQEIDGKNWPEEFKTKSKLAYDRFEKEDIVMSVHALSRLPRLNKLGIPEVSENELIEFIHGFPNYREGDNKLIYFDQERQLLVVKNTMTDEIISVVRRKSLKEEWRSV